ncbi:hypothetical protein [Yinghuangia seranimata]|uniref:hypothetical protein n=1 Tax=Yinghuangia seranimata TaxID=408067 RepID=UPI00248BF11D|nr:hypothetical protein [Yinghuangia seranimata]MDI2129748.1 hypothetical protein [Yinghuangia seranimata]
MTVEKWSTLEEIAEARARFEAAIPGWRAPAAFGVGIAAREPDDAHPEAVFPVVNVGKGPLPAVVMATVCGHSGGTASYELTRERLAEAIALAEPAEACTDVPHPNIKAWRGLLADLDEAGDAAFAVAVFVGDLADPVADGHDAAFRRAVATDGTVQ